MCFRGNVHAGGPNIRTSLTPQLAEALVEHETLDIEEVKKAIKGHKIRQDEKHNVSNVEVTTITTNPIPAMPEPQPQPVPVASASTPEGEQGPAA